MKINCKPTTTPKKALDLDFTILIKKTESKLPVNCTKYRYEMTMFFSKLPDGNKIIMTQYNEDIINKDIRNYLKSQKLEISLEEPMILHSYNIRETEEGFNMIENWKQYCVDLELNIESILEEKRKLKKDTKKGPLAYSKMQKNQLKKTIFKRNKLSILLKKIKK